MPNHATAVLAGHIGSDPEMKHTPSGTAVCNFSLAVNTGYGDRQVTTWWRVSLFGKRAESAGKHLSKGSAVIVDGEPQNRKWQDKDGQDRYSLEITANNWSFAGGKPADKPAASGGAPDQDFEDDIPF